MIIMERKSPRGSGGGFPFVVAGMLMAFLIAGVFVVPIEDCWCTDQLFRYNNPEFDCPFCGRTGRLSSYKCLKYRSTGLEWFRKR